MPFKMLFIILVFLIVLFFAVRWVYMIRDKKGKFIQRIGITTLTLFIVVVWILYRSFYGIAGIHNLSGNAKSNFIDMNEIRSMDGTNIKLKKVCLDLFKIEADYSVWGKEKVVAIEIKKDLNYVPALADMAGLWCGGSIKPEEQYIGMSYKESEFVSPVFIVFYLSNGENISFEVKDKLNIKDSVKVINVSKTIKYDDRNITITKVYKGLKYSALLFESDFAPSNLSFEIINGEVGIKKNVNWSGGGNKYTGSVDFTPMKSNKLEVIIKNNFDKKEDMIEVVIE